MRAYRPVIPAAPRAADPPPPPSPPKRSRFWTIVYWFCFFGASGLAETDTLWFLPRTWRYAMAVRLSRFATLAMQRHKLPTSSAEHRQDEWEKRIEFSELSDCLDSDDAAGLESLCRAHPGVLDRRFFGRSAVGRAVEENAPRCIQVLATRLYLAKRTRLEAQRVISEAFRCCTTREHVQWLVQCGGLPVLAPHCTDSVAQAGYSDAVMELILHGANFPNPYCLQLMHARALAMGDYPGAFEDLLRCMRKARGIRRIQVLMIIRRASPACYQVDDLSAIVFDYLGL